MEKYKVIAGKLHKLIFRWTKTLKDGTVIRAKGRPFPMWVEA